MITLSLFRAVRIGQEGMDSYGTEWAGSEFYGTIRVGYIPYREE